MSKKCETHPLAETEAYISQLKVENKVSKGKELIRPTAVFVAKAKETEKGKPEEKVFINIEEGYRRQQLSKTVQYKVVKDIACKSGPVPTILIAVKSNASWEGDEACVPSKTAVVLKDDKADAKTGVNSHFPAVPSVATVVEISKLPADPAIKTGFLNNISKSSGSSSGSGSAIPTFADKTKKLKIGKDAVISGCGPSNLISEVTAQTSRLPSSESSHSPPALSCNCEGIKKYYVFKNECAKFMFCDNCVQMTSKNNFFLWNDNSVTNSYPQNFLYSCCGSQITEKNKIIYRLYTVRDAENNQFRPVACGKCRDFWVGRLHIVSEHSVKITLFKNNQLCTFLNSQNNICLTSVSYYTETKQPRCAQHREEGCVKSENRVNPRSKNSVPSSPKISRCLDENNNVCINTLRPLFGYPIKPRIIQCCSKHRKTGMMNLTESKNFIALQSFLSKSRQFKIRKTPDDGNCVFSSMVFAMVSWYLPTTIIAETLKSMMSLNPVGVGKCAETLKNNFYTHLLPKINKKNYPPLFSYDNLQSLSVHIQFNFLVILSQSTNSEITPFRSFVFDSSWPYLIIHWNNDCENPHTECVYFEYALGNKVFEVFAWSLCDLKVHKLDYMFSLEESQPNPSISKINKCRPLGGVAGTIYLKTDKLFKEVTIYPAEYCFFDERQRSSSPSVLDGTTTSGKGKLRLYNATGGEESDWFSDGDPTVVYDVSFDTVDGYKKVQESLGYRKRKKMNYTVVSKRLQSVLSQERMDDISHKKETCRTSKAVSTNIFENHSDSICSQDNGDELETVTLDLTSIATVAPTVGDTLVFDDESSYSDIMGDGGGYSQEGNDGCMSFPLQQNRKEKDAVPANLPDDDDEEEPLPAPAAAPLPLLLPPVDHLNYQRLAERLTALTPEQLLLVRDALSPPWNEDVLVENFSIAVTRRIAKCLNPRLWLNDEIINYYMQLAQKWDRDLCLLDPRRKPSYFFNHFFMDMLLQKGYKKVKRWSKRFDIFSLEKIFFPVNILDAHWTLVIALMQEKRILYRDSFGNGGHIYTDAIKRYIVDEMREKRGHTMTQAEQDEWVVEPLPPVHSPRQNNGFDCGTFVCMYADYLLQNLPEQFSQEDMPMLRLKICYCILTGSLLYTV